MSFIKIINNRKSCRSFNPLINVESEKLKKIVEAGILSPSATNSQPYKFYICTGESAEIVKKARVLKINRFIEDVNSFIIIAEDEANALSKIGSRIAKQDYTSMDIGIACSHMVNMAEDLGVSSCILGIFDEKKIASKFNIKTRIRLIIALGYEKDKKEVIKKRKQFEKIVTWLD